MDKYIGTTIVCDNNDVKHSNKCPILLGLDIWDAIIMQTLLVSNGSFIFMLINIITK
jgi:hypothetical protein